MSESKTCPFCGEIIKSVAIKCKHCRSMLNQKDASIKNQLTEQEQQPRSDLTFAEKAEKTGSTLSTIGCLLTLFVTIPIILFFLFLIGGC